MTNLYETPPDLPIPHDDGGADHLKGIRLPSVSLPATNGKAIDLSQQPGLIVVYVYPMTGQPNVALPDGWDSIPGARGCTPQSCSFRDHLAELQAFGVSAIYGISTQSTDYQREAVERLHLPFPLLSDEKLFLAKALDLPLMEVERTTLLKRLAFVAQDRVIEKVFYPVFPPDRSAAEVLEYLESRKNS